MHETPMTVALVQFRTGFCTRLTGSSRYVGLSPASALANTIEEAEQINRLCRMIQIG
jgi:hypothetical protein